MCITSVLKSCSQLFLSCNANRVLCMLQVVYWQYFRSTLTFWCLLVTFKQQQLSLMDTVHSPLQYICFCKIIRIAGFTSMGSHIDSISTEGIGVAVYKGGGGGTSSQIIPWPLSEFDTHPQARLKTLETKISACNAKRLISTILPKNRGLWTVYLSLTKR